MTSEIFFKFLIFLLGSSLFSYVFTTAIRIKKEQKLLSASCCENCQKKIPFWALCPVFGYFLTSGICKSCGYNIPKIYPLGEGVFGFFAILIFIKTGMGVQFIFAIFLFYLFLFVAVFDFFTQQILSVSVLLIFAIQILFLFFFQRELLQDRIFAMLIGAGAFHFISFFYSMLRSRDGLGEGDATLFGIIGLNFGKESLLPILLSGAFIGVIFGVIFLLIRKKSLTEAIPFAPALITGSYLYWFHPEWYTFFSKEIIGFILS